MKNIIFKKYNSIENSYREKEIEKIKNNIDKNELFVATEKVDWTNLSFIVYDNWEKIKIAKRSWIIWENENFYDANKMLEKYKNNFECIFKKLKSENNNITQVQIYWEHFWWIYNWKSEKWYSKIQNRINYCPFTDYIIFDIWYMENKNEDYIKFLNRNKLKEIVIDCWLKHVPEIKIWTFEELLKINNNFNTLIPNFYNLEKIENNITEWIVIKTIEDIRIWKLNERVMLKNKNEKFKEKWKIKFSNINKIEINENHKKWIKEFSKYLEESRVNSVISKWEINIEELKNGSPKEFWITKWLFIKDAEEDLIKDNNDYLKLDKKDKKIIRKEIQKIAWKVLENWIKNNK